MAYGDYEAYLDKLDKKIVLDGENGKIFFLFDTKHEIELLDCQTPEAIKFHVQKLSISLLDSPSVDLNYVTRSFIRSVKEYFKLDYDFESFCRSIDVLEISKHAKPKYQGIQCGTSPIATLCFNGPYCPILLFERVLIADEPYVKVSKRVSHHNVFQVLSQEIEVLQTANYLLLSVTTSGTWELALENPFDEPIRKTLDESKWRDIDITTENHVRHGTRFVLLPSSWEGQEENIRVALGDIYAGLRFDYEGG